LVMPFKLGAGGGGGAAAPIAFTAEGGNGPSESNAAHLHWRVYITAGNGSPYRIIAEMEMRHQVGGSDDCNGGTASASSILDAGFPASKAFDNFSGGGNAWASDGVESTSWLAYQFPSPIEIAEVSIWGSADGSQSIKDFQIQYSDDGTTWTTIASITNQTGWTTLEQRTFTLTLGTISGEITANTTGVSVFRVTAIKAATGELVGTTTTTSSSFEINCTSADPCIVTISPRDVGDYGAFTPVSYGPVTPS
jgi:hypothetical protein